MKKFATFIAVVLTMVFMVGCTQNSDSKPTSTTSDPISLNEPSVTLNDDQSFALSTYLASNILSVTNPNTMSNPLSHFTINPLTNDEVTPVENDLDEINVYFDKLKVFMDQGVDSTLQITEQASTKDGYENEVTYSIEGVTYTIYYTSSELTVDDSNSTTTTTADSNSTQYEITGLIIINDIEYNLEGINTVTDGENDMWLKAVDQNDTNNYVKVMILKEDGSQIFHLFSSIDGVNTQTKIKLMEDDNETKVQLMIKGQDEFKMYLFKKEVSDQGTVYKLNYRDNKEHGVIIIREITDTDGNESYIYKMNGGKQNKEIAKNRPLHRYQNQETNSQTS